MNTNRVLLALVVLFAAAGNAAAAGIDLFWNDCSPSGGGSGVPNRTFACNTNVGVSVLVVSFDPPPGMTNLVGSSATLQLQTASSPLPSWWRLAGGECRDGALVLDTNTASSCANPWGGLATGSLAYLSEAGGNPSRARIDVSLGIPDGLGGPVESGTSYTDFRLVLKHLKTVGSGSCTGCLDPTCIVLEALWLYQPTGLDSYRLCNPLNSTYASWQGPLFFGCPPADGPPPDCSVVPVLRRTWGLIKSIYR